MLLPANYRGNIIDAWRCSNQHCKNFDKICWTYNGEHYPIGDADLTKWNRLISSKASENSDNPQVTIKSPPIELIAQWLSKSSGRRTRQQVETPPPLLSMSTPQLPTSMNTPQIIYMPAPQLPPTFLPAPYTPYPPHPAMYYHPTMPQMPPASPALPLISPHHAMPMLSDHQIQPSLRQSSPVAMAHEEADTILDQYINWLTTQRPDRSVQLLDAGQTLQHQCIDIDTIKEQSEKQLADIGIPIGIVSLLRRHIHDFKIWRRNPTGSRTTTQYRAAISSRPAPNYAPKAQLLMDLLTDDSIDEFRDIDDIDDIDKTQFGNQDLDIGADKQSR
jgi:hypothetical protein